MPTYGGFNPFPQRYGGGEVEGVTLLERTVESLMGAMGSAYTQDRSSVAYVEAQAEARVLVFDGYDVARRLANQFFADTMTVDGLLPRWERIYALPVVPGATGDQRRAAVAGARLAVGQNGSQQPIRDAVAAALGPVFSAYENLTLAEAVSFWPGGTPSASNPWYSTLAHVLIRVRRPPGYTLGQFYGAIGTLQRIMDSMLPSPSTWTWYLAASLGGRGWLLDEPDLDLEILAS